MAEPYANPTDALHAFRELVERLDDGESVDLEAFFASHPAHSRELASLHRGWTRLRESFRELSREPEAGAAWLARPGRRASTQTAASRREDFHRRFGSSASEPRYEVLGQLAEGGMSVIYHVRDRALRRELAMKVLGRRSEAHLPAGESRRMYERFLDEAELTGRLDHPGIVPVHELGLDERGRPFFTMRLVRGRTFGEVIALAREGSSGWTETRALEVLLKVCDAVSYAHSMGIVHRDLKPANVVVGPFGETYVIDWGLAAVLEREEPTEGAPAPREGEIIGTLSYMAPEQARGSTSEIGPASDVYALGAMLYHLLTGRAPYSRPGVAHSSAELRRRVATVPAEPVLAVAPDASVELAAVAEKAMAREPAERYASVSELAEDLRAFIDGRVVRAHARGAWHELSKWILRNRRTALLLALLVAVSVAGALGIAWVEARAKAEVLRLADAQRLEFLEAQAAELWPATPEKVPALEHWLADARALAARLPLHEHDLQVLRERALDFDPLSEPARHAALERKARIDLVQLEIEGYRDELGQLAPRAGETGSRAKEMELERANVAAEREIEALGAAARTRSVWLFRDNEDQWRHDRLAEYVTRLTALSDPDPFRGRIRDVEQRLELARTLRSRSIDDAWRAWDETITSIANPQECPHYQGLRIVPQLGLIPLGRDPRSGLWEFAHLPSGNAPSRGANGRLAIASDSAIVLVLIPGGRFTLGFKSPELGRAATTGEEPDVLKQESPQVELELDPFFLSKYELTQSQWLRSTGENPSYYSIGKCFLGTTIDGNFPVDRVTWSEAELGLRHLGLCLPTEAQWEIAARGGTTTRYWWGDDFEGAALRANFSGGSPGPPVVGDGFGITAPVDALEPNPFGLHHMLGNLMEWTRDNYWTSYRWSFLPGDGAQRSPENGSRALRGGSFAESAVRWRSSSRTDAIADQASTSYGVRPARALDR